MRHAPCDCHLSRRRLGEHSCGERRQPSRRDLSRRPCLCDLHLRLDGQAERSGNLPSCRGQLPALHAPAPGTDGAGHSALGDHAVFRYCRTGDLFAFNRGRAPGPGQSGDGRWRRSSPNAALRPCRPPRLPGDSFSKRDGRAENHLPCSAAERRYPESWPLH